MNIPFFTINHRQHCKCGNHADDKDFGFDSDVWGAFVSTDIVETEKTNFSMGLVAISVCRKCGATMPVGSSPAREA